MRGMIYSYGGSKIVAKANPPPPLKVEVRQKAWPVVIAMFATEEDRGVFDTLSRELGGPKSEKFKRFAELVQGVWQRPCNCSKWNRIYPYA